MVSRVTMPKENHLWPLTSSSLELVVSDGDSAGNARGGIQLTETHTASRQITEEVTSWPGVEAGPGRRGEFAFKLGRREIGHLHGDHAAHFSFPKDVWAELFAAGRVVEPPVFPGKVGPAARAIRDESDVRDVIAL